MLILLIENGANLNVRFAYGQTPIIFSLSQKRNEIALLLVKGAIDSVIVFLLFSSSNILLVHYSFRPLMVPIVLLWMTSGSLVSMSLAMTN